MIRYFLDWHRHRGQRGGIAMLTALGFLLFSVPLITTSLGLAQNTNINARVGTGVLHRQYCGLAVQEYTNYLLQDTVRWENWTADNNDSSYPGTATATLDLCGRNISMVSVQEPEPPEDSAAYPLNDPLLIIPQTSEYDGREFQTFKTVSSSNPIGGDSVTYTITVINRDSTPTTLTQIQDILPGGFAYDWSAAASQLTLPGTAPQDIVPSVIPGGGCAAGLDCLGLHDIVFALDNSGSINSAEFDLLKEAAKLLVDAFYLDATNGAIIGITRFRGSSAPVHVMSDDAASLKASIDALVQGGPGLSSGTDIVAGLEGGALQFSTGQGDRIYPNVTIFITDGDDTAGNSNAAIAAASAATGSEVFAIGVGSISQTTVDAIATDPDDTHSYSVDDFDGLIDLIQGIGGRRDLLVWDMPPDTVLQPGEAVTLAFTALTSASPGTYCNEAQAIPGGTSTTTGATAFVQIGPDAGLCPGEAVVVSKVVDSVNRVSTDTTTNPYTYTFDVDYTIKMDNIGTDDLKVGRLTDLLPEGFSYVSTGLSGDITDPPVTLQNVGALDRQRVIWQLSPPVDLASGTALTLKFSATASIVRGNYWSDLLVDFTDSSFPEDRYTWPTALISVKDLYNVTGTDPAGNDTVVLLSAWVGSVAGVIDTWDIR